MNGTVQSQCICWEPQDRGPSPRRERSVSRTPHLEFWWRVPQIECCDFENFLSLWTSNIVPVTVLPSPTFLNSDRAEQFRRCFPQNARTCIPGCPRCHMRLNAPVQGLEDNFKRYMNSPVMVDAVPAQYTPLLFYGRLPMAFPAPTKSIRFARLSDSNLSHSKRHCQDQEQSAAWYAACETPFLR